MSSRIALQPAHTLAAIAGSAAALAVFCLLTGPFAEALHDRGVVHVSPVIGVLIRCSNFLTTKWIPLIILVGPVLVVLHLLAFGRERGPISRPSQWVLAVFVVALAVGAFVLIAGLLVSMVRLPG